MSIDKQAREELRKRYTPPEIPNCSICGASLSIQRCGGGEPTVYACDGYEADPENPGMVRRAAGRGIADKHYEESRYIDWKKGGDLDVIELLDELQAAEKRIAELREWNSGLAEESCKYQRRIAELEARELTLPDGYLIAPAKASIAMIRAGGQAARKYLEEHGGNSPQVIYQAMIAAADISVKGG